MEKWSLILIAFTVSQCLGDSTRFCCNDEKNWLAGSRKCNGVGECPIDEEKGLAGGEDEDHCEKSGTAYEPATWCHDEAKYPAETEMEAGGTPIGVIIGIVVGVVVIAAAIIAAVVFKIKKGKGDPVPNMEM